MAHQERWSLFFDVLDVDGNGYLDTRDVAMLPKALATAFKLPESDDLVQNAARAYSAYITGLLANFDTNKDGKISREELYDAVTKAHNNTPTVETQTDFWNKGSELLFAAVDANKNGVISLEELSKLIKQINPTATDVAIKEAYDWAIKAGGTGVFDLAAYRQVIHAWTVASGPTPEATLILAFFKKW